MKNWARFFLIVFVCLLLSGCFPKPIIKTEYVVIVPPDALLIPCEVVQPPAVRLYTSKEYWEEREELLIDNIFDHISSNTVCSNRFHLLAKWKQQKIKVWEGKDATIRDDPLSEGEKEIK